MVFVMVHIDWSCTVLEMFASYIRELAAEK